jgi:hypothetical protein
MGLTGRPYNYEIVLETLRTILDREHTFHPANRNRPPDFKIHVRPLVITMEDFLKERGFTHKDYRRDIRLGMLSIILGRMVETTYDLSAYQCSQVYFFLQDRDTWQLDPTAERFLEDLAKRAESQSIQPA